jgi:hypothetical protein
MALQALSFEALRAQMVEQLALRNCQGLCGGARGCALLARCELACSCTLEPQC